LIKLKFSTTITNPNIIDLPLELTFDSLTQGGFDGIDIPGEPLLFPVEKLKQIVESYSNKLPVAEITACVNPKRDLINPDKKIRQRAKDYIKFCIDLADALNVNLTHFCFISNDYNLENTAREKLENLAVDAIKELSRYAHDRSVKLMLEPLFKQDRTIINRADQAVKIFANALKMDESTFLTSQKDFGLLLDIFHMHHEEKDLLKALKKHVPIMFHGHVADHDRALDFSGPASDFVKKSIQELKRLNYQHYISFESFDDSVNLKVLSDSLKVIKSF